MTKKIFSIAITLALFGATSAWASTPGNAWKIDLSKGNGGVEFDATGHPSALRIVGKGAAPKGTFQVKNGRVNGVVSFDLNSLDTGIAMRTRHMKEKYLETQRYQQAKLVITRMKLPAGSSIQQLHADHIPFSGTLLLHGVQKKVTGTAKIDTQGSQISIAADFELKVSDYGIKIPTFAGITMTDEVKISVNDSAPMSPM